MNTEKLSGIVVYTIHDNDVLRNELRNGFKNLGAESLDESTYGIPINGELRAEVINRMKVICETAKENTNSSFCDNDFVTLYWPTNKEESGDDRYLKQTPIIGNKIV